MEELFKEENINEMEFSKDILEDAIVYLEKQQYSCLMSKIKKKYMKIIQYDLHKGYDWLFTITINFIDNTYSINTDFSKYHNDIGEINDYMPYNSLDELKTIIKETIKNNL